eukprot:SAG11_NODE_34425_length_272_cov_0.595376_1_plen_78_part_01
MHALHCTADKSACAPPLTALGTANVSAPIVKPVIVSIFLAPAGRAANSQADRRRGAGEGCKQAGRGAPRRGEMGSMVR